MKRELIATAVLAAIMLFGMPARAQEPSPEAIARALERYAREPSVERVLEAALETRVADPARARDAMDRARATGWLPTLRARLRRGQALSLRTLTTDTTNWSAGDDLVFDASLSLRLDRILFASEEVPLLREQRALEDRRIEIATVVIALYFERRRLQLERDLVGASDVVRTVRVVEIEALLDVFTGGAFTRMMRAPSP